MSFFELLEFYNPLIILIVMIFCFVSVIVSLHMVNVLRNHNRNLNQQIKDLNTSNEELEINSDFLRTPILSASDVLIQIDEMLKKLNETGGKLWIASQTLGFGSTLKYLGNISHKSTRSIFGFRKRMHDKYFDFDTLSHKINSSLVNYLRGNSDYIIVCSKTNKKSLIKNFLAPLSKRNSYPDLKDHIDDTAEDILSLHNNVERVIQNNSNINYKNNLPIQIIVTEYFSKNNDDQKYNDMACIVFPMGMEVYVSGNQIYGEIAFYSELRSLSKMFSKVVEDWAKDNNNA